MTHPPHHGLSQHSLLGHPFPICSLPAVRHTGDSTMARGSGCAGAETAPPRRDLRLPAFSGCTALLLGPDPPPHRLTQTALTPPSLCPCPITVSETPPWPPRPFGWTPKLTKPLGDLPPLPASRQVLGLSLGSQCTAIFTPVTPLSPKLPLASSWGQGGSPQAHPPVTRCPSCRHSSPLPSSCMVCVAPPLGALPCVLLGLVRWSRVCRAAPLPPGTSQRPDSCGLSMHTY